MNVIRLLDEFKHTSNKLLIYNQQLLISLLQKFNFFNINPEDYSSPTGPVAPLVEPSGPQAPTGSIWPIIYCSPFPTGPTGPTGNSFPFGPTGPVSYQTIEAYINNIDCYVDIADIEMLARMQIFNYESLHTLNTEIDMIHNLDNASNYASSQIKTIKRKIHEYDVQIQKLKSNLVDYKQSLQDEYNKKPISQRELTTEISNEISKRLSKVNVVTQAVRELITTQATNDILSKYNTTTQTQKFDAFTAGWESINEKINYLTTERDKFKLLIAPDFVPPKAEQIKHDNNLSLVDQNKYRIKELKHILETLKKANASNDQIQDVVNKISELENKY